MNDVLIWKNTRDNEKGITKNRGNLKEHGVEFVGYPYAFFRVELSIPTQLLLKTECNEILEDTEGESLHSTRGQLK